MSLDGFVAGPRQSVENPLGVGGMRLHEWVFPLAAGARRTACRAASQRKLARGRGIARQHRRHDHGTQHVRRPPGPVECGQPWNGWWGTNPPYHHPVFVLTHHAREPLALEGGTTFTFVTGGIEPALEQARRAARGKDVALAGGAKAAQQYLAAGLVDEMELHLAPTFSAAASACSRRSATNCTGLSSRAR